MSLKLKSDLVPPNKMGLVSLVATNDIADRALIDDVDVNKLHSLSEALKSHVSMLLWCRFCRKCNVTTDTDSAASVVRTYIGKFLYNFEPPLHAC